MVTGIHFRIAWLMCVSIIWTAPTAFSANLQENADLKEAEDALTSGKLDNAETLYLQSAKASTVYAITGDTISEKLCEIARLRCIEGNEKSSEKLFLKAVKIQKHVDKDYYGSNGLIYDQIAAMPLKAGKQKAAIRSDYKASELYRKAYALNL